MSTQHTPGPWKMKTHRDSGRKARHPFIRASNGRHVAAISSIAAKDSKEGMANARLIAAAPDLLEACQLTLSTIWAVAESGRLPVPMALMVPSLKAAIAKATGTEGKQP